MSSPAALTGFIIPALAPVLGASIAFHPIEPKVLAPRDKAIKVFALTRIQQAVIKCVLYKIEVYDTNQKTLSTSRFSLTG